MAKQEEEEDEEERSRQLKSVASDIRPEEKGGEAFPTRASDRELPTPRTSEGREEGSKEGGSNRLETRPRGSSADSMGSPSSDPEQSVGSHLPSRIPTTKKVKNRSGSPSRGGERRGGSQGEVQQQGSCQNIRDGSVRENPSSIPPPEGSGPTLLFGLSEISASPSSHGGVTLCNLSGTAPTYAGLAK